MYMYSNMKNMYSQFRCKFKIIVHVEYFLCPVRLLNDVVTYVQQMAVATTIFEKTLQLYPTRCSSIQKGSRKR